MMSEPQPGERRGTFRGVPQHATWTLVRAAGIYALECAA